MGIHQYIKSQTMNLKWVNEGDGLKTLKPTWYLALEIGYKNVPLANPFDVKKANEEWLFELTTNVWKDLPAQSRIISGAIGLSTLIGGEEHYDTNTDVAFLAQKEVLQAHIESAKQHGFYLMNRFSGKLSKKSNIKYHFFYPITVDQLLNKARNPELTRIDSDANMICTEFTPRNHIKLYIHKATNAGLICPEDKRTIYYPSKYFKGIQTQIHDSSVYVMDPRYSYIKLENIMERNEKNYSKHEPKLERLIKFLRENQDRFPFPEVEYEAHAKNDV